jgi:trk system potassium uptake protein TrkA
VVLVAIIRQGRPLIPDADHGLEAGDELLFVAAPDHAQELEAMLSPH